MADEPQIELINDKWQNILPRYESNWFDLAIVDPPYFDGPQKEKYNKSGKNGQSNAEAGEYKTVDSWDIPDKEYIEQLCRVSKNQIIWGINYYNFSMPGGRICWVKSEKQTPFSSCDIAYHSFYNRIDIYRYTWSGFRQGPTNQVVEDRIHPTQKPVALYRWLLQNYANEGDKILDTHLGSGSSAIAAWQKKHDFVGIECDKEYFNDMLHRFKMNTDREYAMEEWKEQSEKVGQQTIFSE